MHVSVDTASSDFVVGRVFRPSVRLSIRWSLSSAGSRRDRLSCSDNGLAPSRNTTSWVTLFRCGRQPMCIEKEFHHSFLGSDPKLLHHTGFSELHGSWAEIHRGRNDGICLSASQVNKHLLFFGGKTSHLSLEFTTSGRTATLCAIFLQGLVNRLEEFLWGKWFQRP